MSAPDWFVLVVRGRREQQTYANEADAARAAVALVQTLQERWASVLIVNATVGLVIGVAVDDADGARVIVPQR